MTKSKYSRVRIILTVIFALLIIPNLGARALWQDEAETALVAKQMVKSNNWLPYANDGQGPISQDWNYQFSVSQLWRWHPWLQFYVTALSFKLLGISALTARLPFALAGILFFYYWIDFVVKHGPKNRMFYFLAISLVLTSVPLLLHIRQARYYSLALLFTLMAVDGYLIILKRLHLETTQGVTLKYKIETSFKYILGSILLFHSFLPGALALQISFWIHQIYSLIRPGLAVSQGRAFIEFITAFSISLLFTLPWAIWLKIGGQNLNFDLEIIKQNLHWHYIYIHKYIFSFFLLIPFVFSRTRLKLLRNNNILLFSLIIIINLGLYTVNHPYFFRYLVPLIPFFVFMIAKIIISLPNKLAIATVFIAFYPNLKLLPNYLFEITHPYTGTNERIIEMFNSKEFRGIKSLAVNYDDFSFRFHTNLVVHGAQELANLNVCPDSVIIFPEWGNEDILQNIANRCSLESYPSEIHYAKLADDPSPINHRFKPPLNGSVEVYLSIF